MLNGETYKRRWLVYSQSTDKIYCFCCKLFCQIHNSNLSKEGFNDWKHLSERLKSHETSPDHLRSIENWIEVSKRLKSLSGVDKHLQRQINDEKMRWVSILERLIQIVLFLSGHNLSFRGSFDKLNTFNNGNFLGLVELLEKFDPVMIEHLRRIINKETLIHYCSKTIQNELINLLGSEVRKKILSMVKEAKYFSIILDCTSDVSHVEQLSITLRFVDVDEIQVRECFIAYKPVTDSTGEGLTSLFLDNIIQNYDLDMNDCRGQGYDNGANMVGKDKGVQARILRQFPRAFFNTCGCHSLNLVVADAVKTSVKSISLFGILQRLFVLFSASTKRWDIMKKYVKSLSLKKICETRWESRISSLEAVRFQYPNIIDALIKLYEETDDPVFASEAKSLAEHMEGFEFLFTLVIWYDILFQVNIVSKAMQSETMDISNASKLLEKCLIFVTEYRNTGYSTAIITAKDTASEAEIKPVFKAVRIRRKKRMFGYEASDEMPSDPEELFKTTVFYPIIDTIESALKTRFEQLSTFNTTWSFLYNLKTIPDEDRLQEVCINLEAILTDGDKSDISGNELKQEILSIRNLLNDSGEPLLPLKVLQLIHENKWQDIFPNLWTALRILLTITVTVASGERSFSKLKLIKTYLRSTMLEDRLSDLAILSIENDFAKSLNFTEIIQQFASAKARKVYI